jgi:hypothetical protein
VEVAHGSISVSEFKPEDQLPAAGGAVVGTIRLGVVAAKTAPEPNTSIIRASAIRKSAALRTTFIQSPDLAQLL